MITKYFDINKDKVPLCICCNKGVIKVCDSDMGIILDNLYHCEECMLFLFYTRRRYYSSTCKKCYSDNQYYDIYNTDYRIEICRICNTTQLVSGSIILYPNIKIIVL